MDQADIYGGYGAEALLGAAFKAAPGCATRSSWSPNAISSPRSAATAARVKHYDTSRGISPPRGELAAPDGDGPDRPLLIHRPDPLMDHPRRGARWMRWSPRARCARWACRTSGPGTGRCCNRRWRRRWSPTRSRSARCIWRLHQWRSGVSSGTRAPGHGVVAAGGRARCSPRRARPVREVLTRIGHEQGVDAARRGGGVAACGIRRGSCR
jgi:hypothetical protein